MGARHRGADHGAIDQLGRLDELGRIGLVINKAALLHHAVRLGAADRVTAPLAELAHHCDSELVDAYARHANALSSRDPIRLLDHLGALRAHGGGPVRSGNGCQASALWRVSSRHDRPDRGGACPAAYRPLRQGAHTRTPRAGSPSADHPTRKVTGMAAHGLTNRQIAERQTLSVRWIENHLYSVYAKLGIHGREQLPGIRPPGINSLEHLLVTDSVQRPPSGRRRSDLLSPGNRCAPSVF